jgi:elongation factor Ts
MATVTPQLVKQLRDQTGAGMSDCKKALEEAAADFDRAVTLLREKGLAAAAKKSGRAASEGVVTAILTPDRNYGYLVEVNCETDFVTRNDAFQKFVAQVSHAVEKARPKTLEDVHATKLGDGSATIKDAAAALVATIGENIAVRRFATLGSATTFVQSYVHAGGKVGVLVELTGENIKAALENPELHEVGKDVALQVAAMKPLFLNRESITPAELKTEEEIFTNQYRNQGKPENILPKIVASRMETWFKEACLLEQAFVKEDSKNITQYVNEASKKLGIAGLKVSRFARLELGEGVEKKEEDFAAEVEAQIKSSSK